MQINFNHCLLQSIILNLKEESSKFMLLILTRVINIIANQFLIKLFINIFVI